MVIASFAGFTLLFFSCKLHASTSTYSALHPFIKDGGYFFQVSQSASYSSRAGEDFTPASTIKILTVLLALEILGPEYRYRTSFYRDQSNNLYIKGSGDPFLTTEYIHRITTDLLDRNIGAINRIVLDDFSFNLSGPPPGSENSHNPYDAHSNGLAVNFNSLPVKIGKGRTIQSGEPQTPLLPFMKRIGKSLPKGKHRVNVNSLPGTANISNTLRYTGELFQKIFEMNNIFIENGFTRGITPPNAQLLYFYDSAKTVEELARSTLLYSNNFIANQLFLTSGQRLLGGRATWAKAQKALLLYIEKRLPRLRGKIIQEDGSGLSVKNKISPAAMITILDRFRPYAHLLRKKGNIYVKSGTLTGVYCYAGYFSRGKELFPYALFLNQKKNTRKKILKLMQSEFSRYN